jgi:hypothetical protein
MMFFIIVWVLFVVLLLVADVVYRSVHQIRAENAWIAKYGEIPDGFRLVYKKKKCRLRHNFKVSFTLDEWLRIPYDVQDQIDMR